MQEQAAQPVAVRVSSCAVSPSQPDSRRSAATVMISDRPLITDRAVPGHWEGGLICGAGNRSAIGTLVERTTRFTILLHLPDGHDAEHVQDAVIRKMRTLPSPLPNSLTWDRGSELALHTRVSAALDMQVCFCDPHSPWQRGNDENTSACCASTSPREPTCPDTPGNTSTRPPRNPTTGPARPWDT